MPIGAILGGALAGGGALFGALTGAGAATSAANTQAQSAAQALAFAKSIYDQTGINLAPYLSLGTGALSSLATGLGVSPGGGFNLNAPLLANPQNALGPPPTLTSAMLPTYSPSGFQQSPGYAWQLEQGIQGIQDAATGPQGTLSGNMLKAAGTYATGLSNQDYYNWLQQIYNPGYQSRLTNVLLPFQSASNNYLTNLNQANLVQGNALNALSGLAGAGQTAANTLGSQGASLGNLGSGLIAGSGNALAAGRVGSANALTGGVNSLSSYLLGPNFGNYYGGSNLSSILGNFGLGTGGGGSSYNPAFISALLNNGAVGPQATQTPGY